MSRGIKAFFEEFNEILVGGIRGYRNNFISLIASFVLLNTLSVLLLNVYMTNENLRSSYKLSIYFQETLSEEKLTEFEKKMLSIDEIISVKYESKEIALRELESQLGIRISKGNNPLTNNFLITYDGPENLGKLQEKLDQEELIKEVYIDEEQIEKLNNKILINRSIIIALLIAGITPLIYIIFSLFHGNILYNNREITSKVYIGMKKSKAVRPYYYISDFIFVSSSIIGTLTFLNMYEIFRKSIDGIEKTLLLSSMKEIVSVVAFVTIVTTVVFPIASRIIYKVDGE